MNIYVGIPTLQKNVRPNKLQKGNNKRKIELSRKCQKKAEAFPNSIRKCLKNIILNKSNHD